MQTYHSSTRIMITRIVMLLSGIIIAQTTQAQSERADRPAAAGNRQEARGATGVVEGRIFNAATGTALDKVRVMVAGSNRETFSDPSGSYRIAGLPEGDVDLIVSYIGLSPQKITVNVSGGAVSRQDVELSRSGLDSPQRDSVVALKEFNVVAEREMSAQSIAANEQRYAPNIKNVVAIDEYGDQGDESVMGFLRFLPGVTIADNALGAGSMSVRGFPDNNTEVLVDGGEFASARSGNTRTVVLIEVPMSNVSRVEVTKVPTPDMSASGLGGSINLISKSGFETRKPVFAYQISTQFHNKSGITFDGGRRNHIPATSPKYTQPSFNLSYLRPVGKTLAFTFGLSRTWRLKQMFSGNDAAETANWDLINPVQRTSTWINNAQVLHTWTGQFGAEWRISPTDTVSASVEYRATSNTTSGSGFLANYGAGATGGPTFSQGAATGVGVVTQGNRVNWERPNKNTHATVKYAHKGPVWRLDGSGSFSFADGRLFDIDNGYFSTTPATISTLILRGDGIPAAGGILPRNYTATTRTGTPVDVYDGANYVLGSATSDQNVFYTTKTSAKVDLGRDFTGQIPFTVKVGLSNSQMQRDEKRFTRTWNFRPNGLTTDAARLAGNFDVFDPNFTQPLYSHPMKWISSPKVYALYRQHPDWFVLDEAGAHQNKVSNSREFSEAISAAYLRADLHLFKNRLWIVAGWRVEHTSVKGAGPLDDVGAQYQTTANGDYVRDAAGQKVLITTNAVDRAKLRYQERGAHASNAYDTYHPSVNTTFTVAENLVLRAAYARTIGRPQVSFIVPGTTISDPDVASPTITVSNTGLKPWTADNYDLSLESYFIKNGFGSIGVFQKNIKNFFGATRTAATPALLDQYGLPNDADYLQYEVVTQSNVGDATIKGFEFSYRQALTFLPLWARGLQLSFNASRMTLDGSNSADFTGFSPSSYSGGLNLVRPRFYVKLNWTYQGETQRALAAPSSTIPVGTYNYLAARTQWGLSAQYSLSKRFAIYASAVDIGGGVSATLRYAPGTPEYARPVAYGRSGYYTTVGFKGEF